MKRRFFQIHLLTAVVGMLICSVFLWANVTVWRLEYLQIVRHYQKNTITFRPEAYAWVGWPVVMADEYPLVTLMVENPPYGNMDSIFFDVAYPLQPRGISFSRLNDIEHTMTLSGEQVVTLEHLLRQDPSLILAVEKTPPRPSRGRFSAWTATFYERGVLINAGVALAGILLAMMGVESILRRRERAKV